MRWRHQAALNDFTVIAAALPPGSVGGEVIPVVGVSLVPVVVTPAWPVDTLGEGCCDLHFSDGILSW